MKLLSVIGARPHFMKVAPILQETSRQNIDHEVVHTGQHYDHNLSENYLEELCIPSPIKNLNVGSIRPALQIAKIIEGIDQVIEKTRPDFILVYGDTNSTAGAAIAAAKNFIPLVHVEAGLREHRKEIPEEINKLLIDSVSDIFCCPTKTAVAQLEQEGKKDGIVFTGDVVFDLIKNNEEKIEKLETPFVRKWRGKEFFFATFHRDINTTVIRRLREIVDALIALPYDVIVALHPRTKVALEKFKLIHKLDTPQIHITPSMPFWETQWLISNARLTLTDSGGISKESYFHKTGCLLLDDQIEWIELVESGWLKICGADANSIVNGVLRYQEPEIKPDIFGKGNAAAIIVEQIKLYYARQS